MTFFLGINSSQSVWETLNTTLVKKKKSDESDENQVKKNIYIYIHIYVNMFNWLKSQ